MEEIKAPHSRVYSEEDILKSVCPRLTGVQAVVQRDNQAVNDPGSDRLYKHMFTAPSTGCLLTWKGRFRWLKSYSPHEGSM